MKLITTLACAGLICAGAVLAGCDDSGKNSDQTKQVKAEVFKVTDKGNGEQIGTVTFTNTSEGLEIRTDLKDLPPGPHGFHVHGKADCSPAEKDGVMTPALAAGGHYDPLNTHKHLGPDSSDGHKGDLPVLEVADDGTAKITSVIKGVKAEDFQNRSVMIHAGGDNYSDVPVELGGGGTRIACGVIK